MDETTQPDQPTVTITVPASAARLAAEELFQSARQARDNGELGMAALLETAAGALHSAGWDAALCRTAAS